MKREFVCINCPMGCLLTVTGEPGSLRIEGYTCPRGLSYAESEVTDPRRTVTALVQVEGRRPAAVGQDADPRAQGDGGAVRRRAQACDRPGADRHR